MKDCPENYMYKDHFRLYIQFFEPRLTLLKLTYKFTELSSVTQANGKDTVSTIRFFEKVADKT